MKPQSILRQALRWLLILTVATTSLPAAAASSATSTRLRVAQTEPAPSYTAQTSPEWMNFYGLQLWLDGQPAPTGTRIEAFTPDGLPCGQTTVSVAGQFGLLTVYRDAPNTAEVEGPQPGQTISFKMGGRQAAVLGDSSPTWTEHGALQRVDLVVGEPPRHRGAIYLPLIISHDTASDVVSDAFAANEAVALPDSSQAAVQIPLAAGWNLISFNQLPANPDVTAVLASISGLYSVVLGYDRGGLSYYPQLPPTMNTLTALDPYHGYWIRMNAPALLSISGAAVSSSTPIALYPGWNLVGYLPDGPEPVATALASIAGQYTAVTSYAGEALYYYPSLPPEMSNLRTMDVYRGYWINMTSARSLVYPAAAQTATPVPTATPLLALPGTPTPLPTASPTATLAPRLRIVRPPATITTNTTWSAADGVFVIENNVTVNQGVVLSIGPGAVIKFNNTGLIINGSLIAEGTANAPVTFTSLLDDNVGGDTNNDGAASTPTAGNWGALYFSPSSNNSRLRYARLAYGGGWDVCCDDPLWQPATLSLNSASPLIENILIDQGTTYGLLLVNSAGPVMRNSRISHIAGTGVQINSSSRPTFENNVIEGNQGYAVFMQANTAPRFTGNRAISNGMNGIGVNGTIAPSVAWDSDLPYVIDGGLSINPGITLDLRPGAVLKFRDQNQSLVINGTLRAPGTLTNPIVLTSFKDDSAGGDTNNDGSASRPDPGDWVGLSFSTSSTNSTLEHVIVRYAGGYYPNTSIGIDGSAPTIRNSQIRFSSGHGIQLNNLALPTIADSLISDNAGNGLEMSNSASAILTNNGFNNNTGFAVHMDATCSVSATGNTATQNTFNGIGVSGEIPASTTWLPNLPYIIDGGVIVGRAATLTLQPGVVVKFRSGNLLVNGALLAQGVAGNKIVFTSLNDVAASAAGQTLGKISLQTLETALAPGDWGRIEFAPTSSASTLDHVVVRYGGACYWECYGSLYLNGSAPSISNSIISHSNGYGMRISGSSPTLLNNTITENADTGIYVDTLANPVLHNNLIYGNTNFGLYNASSEVTLDATNNWWGHAGGPTHPSIPSGKGDQVSDGINFIPWLSSPTTPTPTPYPTPSPTPSVNYVSGEISSHTTWTTANSPYIVNGSVSVRQGVILSIQTGVIVKFTAGAKMEVYGVLAAVGTTDKPITFTSIQDDAYGGDTNANGASTRPQPGDWHGLVLQATASVSTLSYLLIRYATNSVTISGSSPRLSHSTIMLGSGWAINTSEGAPTIEDNILRDNLGGGIDLSGSPVIRNNTIVNNGDAAIRMTPSALPDNSGNRAYYNVYNGIMVSGGTATVRGTWHKDLPYVMNGGLTIETGVMLTLAPGVILKFLSGDMIINGGLIANSSDTERIVFTSIHDDSVGGDTNNNGSQTWPVPGNWGALNFTPSSLGTSSVTGASITYGGWWYYYPWYTRSAVRVESSSPTIADNLIAFSAGYGLQVEALGAPTIQDNIVRDNRSHGLILSTRAAPVVQNNRFMRNQGYAVYMDAGCTPTFIDNTADDNRTNGVGVSGSAGTSTTWKANLIYIIESLAIESGVTLTLEPGTITKFAGGASISAYGNLVAVGTGTSRITFTSLKDDAVGGDTNNDGNTTAPAAGDWNTIQYEASSTTSRLAHAVFSYGGGNQYWDPYSILYWKGVAFTSQYITITQSLNAGIRVDNANPTFNNVDVSHTRYGIYLNNAHATVTNSTIRDSSEYGVFGGSSNPTITGCTISNSNWGVYLSSTSAPYPRISGNTFANNRLGAASIEAPALSTFGLNTFVGTVGNGVSVGSGTVAANATIYGSGVYALGDVTVEQGAALTVQPGAVVKLRHYCDVGCYYGPYGASLLIRGALNADGTTDRKIIFTSERDDAYGGDTNADGVASGPAVSDWGAIYFTPTASTSLIDNAVIKYAGAYGYDPYPYSFSGAGVHANNTSPTISNSTIQDNGAYGIFLNGASPTLTGNTISGQSYAIYAGASSYPTITSNTISSVGTGVYLDESSHATFSNNTFVANGIAADLKADALSLVGQNTRVNTTGNYINVRSGEVAANTTLFSTVVYLLGDVVVNSGVVLTVQPGTVVKFAPTYCCWQGGSLLMRGRLAAQGTSSQKIVFTADTDDTYGGDTNGDGVNSMPGPGRWSGIYLNTSDSNLSYVVLNYGGSYFSVDGTGYGASLILNNVSPSVSHSTIGRSGGIGIFVRNASPNISDNDIYCNQYGIWAENGARPAIHNNTIRDSVYYGVYNADTDLVVDARNNSWGHDSGPQPIGAGNGVNYSDTYDTYGQWIRTYHVAFDPWNGKTHWIEQNLGVLKQWVAYVAEPVNTATGNYTYNYEDVRISGRGLSLSFQRFYNAQGIDRAKPAGPMGYGWTFNYGMSVREEDGYALVTAEDGRVDKYAPDGIGGYTPPKGSYDVLLKSGGLFTLKRKDQTRYVFSTAGKLASIVDRNSNSVTLAYSGSNLTNVTDPSGRQLALSYNGANRISQVTDPAGRTIRFAYDEFGNLISVTDARNNTTNYAYDSKSRMITITDPNGHIFVTNIYDADGRVITQRDAKLNNTTFSYDIYSKVTTVTDPLGSITTYSYDAELRLQYERDPANQTISYSYDSNSNRTSITDRRGNMTRYAYDTVGNTTFITDSLSSVVAMAYNGMNDLISRTDPLGRVTRYSYDAKGNLTRTTDALGNATAMGYDANGLMTSITDARGNTATFVYNAHGYQTSATDPLGKTKTSTYDSIGRKLNETDALARTTTYTYDANNNPLTVRDAANGVTTYTYDAVGNRVTVTDPLGRVTRYAYDQKDMPISVTNALGGVIRYEYDANNNKIRETDPLTHTTEFSYDALNRLTQMTDPLSRVTSYGYDVDGNRTSVTDANGRTTNFAYDALNRLTRVTDPLLNTTSYVYDAVGNKLRVMDANGNTTRYEYDAVNRLVNVTDAIGGVVRYAYDSVGNKTSMTDANNHITTYVYDALNRLTSVTDPLNNKVQYGYDAAGNRINLTNARGQGTTYAYDVLNRLINITYPGGGAVTYAYDALGNRTQMTDDTGTTTYAYDTLNRVTRVTNPGNRVVSYEYDAASNRTKITYPDGKAVFYTYDEANRLTRVTDWADLEAVYAYDNVGNLTTQTNPNNTSVSLTYDAANRLTGVIHSSTISGTIASFSYTLDKVGNRTRVVDTEGITTYEYDKLYRLTAVTYPDAVNALYQYDPMGNRLAMTTTHSATRYTYDAADRLLTTTTGGATTNYSWDADGNMLSKGSQAFTYDAINRLTQVVSGTLTVGYAYDGDGRRASKTVNGTATSYTYDTIAGLAYVLTETTGGNTSLYTYGADLIADTNPAGAQSYYHTDGLGSTRGLTNGSGQVTARYTYDAFGAVRSSSGTGSTAFRFAGEQTDDEVGLVYLRARYYDSSIGRFTALDPVPGRAEDLQSLNRYVYVKNNPTNYIDPSGEIAPLILALVGVPAVIGAAYAFLSHPEPVNAPTWDQPYLYKSQPFRPAVHAAKSLALSKLFSGIFKPLGLTPNLREGGLLGGIAATEKWALGDVTGDLLDRVLYGDGRVPNPYYRPLELQDTPDTPVSRLAEKLGVPGYKRGQGSQPGRSGEGNQQYPGSNQYGALFSAVEAGPAALTQDVISGNYVVLARLFRQAGFNPANPQPPPSHSK